eukprot:4028238-Alexandrium_andersonii.AAC.1
MSGDRERAAASSECKAAGGLPTQSEAPGPARMLSATAKSLSALPRSVADASPCKRASLRLSRIS